MQALCNSDKDKEDGDEDEDDDNVSNAEGFT